MYLEDARAFAQGILLLAFAAVAYWVNPGVGLALVALVGVMKLQESASGWCPSDVVFRPMGLKKRVETVQPAQRP